MLDQIEKQIQEFQKKLWKQYEYINLNKSPISRKFLGIPIPVLRTFQK